MTLGTPGVSKRDLTGREKKFSKQNVGISFGQEESSKGDGLWDLQKPKGSVGGNGELGNLKWNSRKEGRRGQTSADSPRLVHDKHGRAFFLVNG
jgi:hypothetical protein